MCQNQCIRHKYDIVYMGGSSTNPQIGDVRVTITKTEPCDISILAKVNGNTFEKYVAKNGKTVSRVAQGTVGAETMFADAHSENSMMTWMLRLVGVLMVIGGLCAMFSIVETLFKVLPFLANIVGAGVGLIVAVAGIAWSVLVIAIAWLAYRPVIAIALLVVSGALIFYLIKHGKEKKAALAAV
ncbi:TMEM43 family protein [Petrimonas sulfuriphila]|uniref:TMEM43 family protein n=1 Tax=Petrimonas sulfuriphila TaxID=285070 RepID=UPI000E9DFA25|nr:hypothetical protein [Porphyromonadaceae bacterium]